MAVFLLRQEKLARIQLYQLEPLQQVLQKLQAVGFPAPADYPNEYQILVQELFLTVFYH